MTKKTILNSKIQTHPKKIITESHAQYFIACKIKNLNDCVLCQAKELCIIEEQVKNIASYYSRPMTHSNLEIQPLIFDFLLKLKQPNESLSDFLTTLLQVYKVYHFDPQDDFSTKEYNRILAIEQELNYELD